MATGSFPARFRGRCGNCPAPVEVGHPITRGDSGFVHVDCGDAMADLFERGPLPKHEGIEVDLTLVPAGRFAVESKDGLTFLRIDKPSDGKWNGWAFVKRQAGDTFDRLGSARPGLPYRGAAGALVAQVAAEPTEAMARYGRELGHCGRCGRTLTDDESRAFGIGPDCRAMMGAAA